MTRFATLRQIVRTVLPRPVIRFVWNAASDLQDLPRRFSGEMPPQPFRLMHNVGGGDYHETGRYFAERIASQTGLKPEWTVLDVGCGTGRIAAPMVQKLGPGGAYIGFDLSAPAVRWAQKHVEKGEAKVEFVCADLSNTEYNRDGAAQASQYVFPAEPEQVDLCFAISLFTHLKSVDAKRYLQECGRVLKPGGRVYLTAFLLTPHTHHQIANGRSSLAFQRLDPETFTTDLKTPEHATAFEESDFLAWAEAAGLHLIRDIKRGGWSEPRVVGDLQDELVFEKPASETALGA